MGRGDLVCSRCGASIEGDAVRVVGAIFCGERCERESKGDAVDDAARDSFPASDPPSRGSPAIAAALRRGWR